MSMIMVIVIAIIDILVFGCQLVGGPNLRALFLLLMGTSSLELSGKATAAVMLLAAEPMVVVGPDVAFKIASQGTLEEVLTHLTIEHHLHGSWKTQHLSEARQVRGAMRTWQRRGGRALLDCFTTMVVVRSMVSDVLHALLQQAFKMLWISALSGQGRVSDSDAMPGCYFNILTNTTNWAVSGGELLVLVHFSKKTSD